MGNSDEITGDAPGSRTRVLLMIKCLDYGGAERLLIEMAARGDRESFEYEAAYVLKEADGLTSAMRSTGTPVHSLGASGNWDLSWMVAFRRLLVNHHYDVVHFHLPYAASVGRLVVRSLPHRSRPKVVYTEHGTWGFTNAPVRILNRATIRLDDALVTVSESARQALPKALRPRAEVVIHGMDMSRSQVALVTKEKTRQEVRDEFGIPSDHMLILKVGNLRPSKGYEVLLEAARILVARGVPVSFITVGYGPLADEMKRLHGELQLGDRFRFLGPRDDVIRLMAGSDIFTLSSHLESLPVVVMEAASLGLPMVLTAAGEIPRILTDSVDALIVPPGRPDMLADSLERVARDSGLRERLGKAALELSEMFDATSAARQVEDLYRRILAEAT